MDGYILNQSGEVRKALEELRSLILRAAPDAVQTFNYAIPAFALVPGGKRDQQIMMAGFKKHVGLYPHPDVIEHFSEELRPYKSGKGSVQFPLDRPLPADLIVRMVRYRLAMLTAES